MIFRPRLLESFVDVNMPFKLLNQLSAAVDRTQSRQKSYNTFSRFITIIVIASVDPWVRARFSQISPGPNLSLPWAILLSTAFR